MNEHDLSSLIEPLKVKPGSRVTLPGDFDPGFTAEMTNKKQAKEILRSEVELLADYQARLAAQDVDALVVLFQGIDASGKDGAIKHVMSGVNPQGVEVRSFKVPSVRELDHDFLWRYHYALPERGKIGIFNRSHYEEVLVVRVHPEAMRAEHVKSGKRGDEVWLERFRQINDWERFLAENGYHLVKLFLNVSKDEQRRRFLKRIDRPEKNWKFSPADVREREHWDRYQEAFADALSNTSTEWAPWHVIPADHKWFARLASAAVIIEALAAIDPQYPVISGEDRQAMLEEKRRLEAEGAGTQEHD